MTRTGPHGVPRADRSGPRNPPGQRVRDFVTPVAIRPFPARKGSLTLHRVVPTCPHACLPLVKPEAPPWRHAAVANCQRDIGTGQVVPMASTRSAMQADPRFDGDLAAMVVDDHFSDFEQALARLVHASYPSDAPGGGAESERSADARNSQSLAAGTPGAATLRSPSPRKQRSRGKRRTRPRVAMVLCVGACSIWAWRLYGGSDPAPEQAAAPPATEMAAPPSARAASRPPSQAALIAWPATAAANGPGAASPERRQIDTSDLAALRQTVEQLAAGQERLTNEIAKLRAEKPQADKPPTENPDKRMLHRASADPAPPVASSARKPAQITPMPPQAARGVATASAVSRPPRPAPQVPSETQSSNQPPLRPPMPVPPP